MGAAVIFGSTRMPAGTTPVVSAVAGISGRPLGRVAFLLLAIRIILKAPMTLKEAPSCTGTTSEAPTKRYNGEVKMRCYVLTKYDQKVMTLASSLGPSRFKRSANGWLKGKWKSLLNEGNPRFLALA